MTTAPTLFLTVGLPATGKTTAARRLETEHGALRLTKDEWMKALYGAENPEAASDVIEGRLVQIGLRALELGCDVVIDFGLWGRDERSALRQATADRGAQAVVLAFSATRDEQLLRHAQRLAAEPGSTWPITEQELDAWARSYQEPTPGEIDGSEPIDAPPPPFSSWDDWRADRWPSAIT